MPRPIRTFDVFDTLIARRGVEARCIFDKLEASAGLPGLKDARLKADQALWSQGKPYLLSDIWHEVQRSLGLERLAADRWMELEIQLELEDVIPIAENMVMVRDGDLLVSDTNLPPELVRSLLLRAGFDRKVGLVTSNDGKFRGSIWPRLLKHVSIERHLGDNPESDIKTANAAGIETALTTLAKRSPVERLLVDHGCVPLANLLREVRLANPFSRSDPRRRHLWALGCQLNFPLLYFASHLLDRHASAQGIRDILFVSRDCFLWHKLYLQLFPHRRSSYFYTSRKCLFHPSADYMAYFRANWHPDSLIVDLTGTGISWSKFLSRLDCRARFFLIGRIDDYFYLKDSICPDDWMEITAVFRNSELSKAPNKFVEMLNYAPHPVVEDVISLPGQAFLPVLADTLEYDAALPSAVAESITACLLKMSHYPELARSQPHSPIELVKTFVGLICADPHLGSIYAGHQAMDEAYMRRVLAAAPDAIGK